MAGLLDGIRIVDLTYLGMGGYCTMYLGDMGADVIKVESPKGDDTRRIGPARHPDMAALFLQFNRNKRSIAVNLRNKAGRDAVRRLASGADVFVHSMRSAKIRELGLAYEDFADSALIHCGVYGFGNAGRYRDRPAYDDMIQAASGLASLQPTGSTEARYVGTIMVDKTVGIFALSAILAALVRRQRTGKGQAVEVPMFETMSAFVLEEHMYGHVFVPPIGSARYPRLLTPNRRPYQTADGFLSVMPYNDAQWARMFQLVGRPELAADEAFATMQSRTQNIDRLYGILAAAMLAKTNAEWLRALGAADIAVMPVNTIEQVMEDPHLNDVGLFPTTEHPTEGALRMIANPITWSGTPATYRRPAPRVGEHTREILLEAGFAHDEVERLVLDGAVVAAHTPA